MKNLIKVSSTIFHENAISPFCVMKYDENEKWRVHFKTCQLELSSRWLKIHCINETRITITIVNKDFS